MSTFRRTCACGQWNLEEYGPVCPSRECVEIARRAEHDALRLVDTEYDGGLPLSAQFVSRDLVIEERGTYAQMISNVVVEVSTLGNPSYDDMLAEEVTE